MGTVFDYGSDYGTRPFIKFQSFGNLNSGQPPYTTMVLSIGGIDLEWPRERPEAKSSNCCSHSVPDLWKARVGLRVGRCQCFW